ncbi:MAG: TraR/DksA family transcriptional regulator, partial [Hymenobacter sp.]
MTEENLRYSREDLAEFDQIIQSKLTAARKELSF